MTIKKKARAGSSELWGVMSSKYDAVLQLVLNVYSVHLTGL